MSVPWITGYFRSQKFGLHFPVSLQGHGHRAHNQLKDSASVIQHLRLDSEWEQLSRLRLPIDDRANADAGLSCCIGCAL